MPTRPQLPEIELNLAWDPHRPMEYLRAKREEGEQLYHDIQVYWPTVEQKTRAAWEKWAAMFSDPVKLRELGVRHAWAVAWFVRTARRLINEGKRLGYPMQYFGERAFARYGCPRWIYKRGKKALEAVKGLYKFEPGGGRLGKQQGGGKDRNGKYKGAADGMVPGSAVTGWSEEIYATLMVAPPPKPAVRLVDPTDETSHQAGQHVMGNLRNLYAAARRINGLLRTSFMAERADTERFRRQHRAHPT